MRSKTYRDRQDLRVEIELRQRKYALLLALLLDAVAIETFHAQGAARLLSDMSRTLLGVAIWFVVFDRASGS